MPTRAIQRKGCQWAFEIDRRDPHLLYLVELDASGLEGLLLAPQRERIGTFRLFDDGLSIYAEWLPQRDGIDPQSVGPVRVLDRKSGRRATLLIEPEANPESVVFVLDASGSMRGEKLERAKDALLQALEQIVERTEIGVFVFFACDDIRRLADFRSDREVLTRMVPTIKAHHGTPLGDALARAYEYLHKRSKYPPERRRLVLLSDGQATCGREPVDVIGDWNVGLSQDQTFVVIGLEVSGSSRQSLEVIARAANGSYVQADRQSLSRTLGLSLKRADTAPP